jgi:hypothetical protein
MTDLHISPDIVTLEDFERACHAHDLTDGR